MTRALADTGRPDTGAAADGPASGPSVAAATSGSSAVATPAAGSSAAAAQDAARRRSPRALRVAVTTVVLVVVSLGVAVFSASLGQFATSPGDVVAAVWHAVTGTAPADAARTDAVLWSIRFPRVVLSLAAGACLGVAGAVMQGVFANPLAEPSIIGVTSGASVGATLVIVLGTVQAAVWAVPAAAFAGAVVITLLVWVLARTGGRAAVLTLVLTGIALNAMSTAATSFLIFLGDASSREQVIFWRLGSLADASWQGAGATALVFAVGLGGCLAIRRPLDVLALGDRSAAATGIHVERLRVVAIVLSCLLTGVAVAFCGVIAFVGLIVPHAIRLVTGPSHRWLVPLSALGGAVLLGLADVAARTVIPYADLPIGIFTAAVGGPIFLLLLRRTLSGTGVLS